MARIYKIGTFEHEDQFLSTLKALTEKKINVWDAFTPYPIHEVFHLLHRKSKLPLAAYFFGLFGIAATLGFLYYTSVIDWPIVYGGKPFNSFPSFVIVTIVITIFTVTILSLGLFSARSRLVPGKNNTVFQPAATDNRFIIVVEDLSDEAVKIMKEGGAIDVTEKEFEKVFA